MRCCQRTAFLRQSQDGLAGLEEHLNIPPLSVELDHLVLGQRGHIYLHHRLNVLIQEWLKIIYPKLNKVQNFQLQKVCLTDLIILIQVRSVDDFFISAFHPWGKSGVNVLATGGAGYIG